MCCSAKVMTGTLLSPNLRPINRLTKFVFKVVTQTLKVMNEICIFNLQHTPKYNLKILKKKKIQKNPEILPDNQAGGRFSTG